MERGAVGHHDAGTCKKLIEAGFVWARSLDGGADDLPDEVFAQLPEETRRRLRPTFIVNFDAWPAFELFRTCSTQWRWLAPGMGAPRRIGLDYAAVVAVKNDTGNTATIEQVRMCEVGALAAWSGRELTAVLDNG